MSVEFPCIHYENHLCKKFEEPGYRSWCVLGPCSHQEPSHGDRIRSMCDEELADFIQHIRNNTLLAEALGVPVPREEDLEFVRQSVKDGGGDV